MMAQLDWLYIKTRPWKAITRLMSYAFFEGRPLYPYEDLIGSYSTGPAAFRLPAEEASTDVRERARRLFGAYLAGVGSARLVDKYPELVFRVSFVKTLFPDSIFIFLIRNGSENCQSVEQWSRKHGGARNGAKHDWWGLNDRKWKLLVDQVVETDPAFKTVLHEIRDLHDQKDRAAVEWTVAMREGMRRMRELPDSIRLVRYEDLATRPEPTLRDLLGFRGLADDDRPFWEYALQTIRPPRPRKPVSLHPAIRPMFDQTMLELGYAL